jgi:hypothetical protein
MAGRWNHTDQVQWMTFKLQMLNLLKPFAIITILASSLSVFTVYIRVKYRGQVVSTLGLIPEVVDFFSASSQIPG